jgi:hypothetical protein
MRNPLVEAWEAKLNGLLRQVITKLEEDYGAVVPRHPARPAHGETPNPQNDGLFRITGTFTPGYGSQWGKGYVLDIEPVTLDEFPRETWATVEAEACRMIQEGLEAVLPGRGLELKRDGSVWKIIGDLALNTHE